jgi:mannose-6-phosphate isomerase-like protein (cupin superfamily)
VPFVRETRDVGVVAGASTGLLRLVVQLQPVAADEVAYLHRHDAGDQILRVISGEVLMRVGTEVRRCAVGDTAVVPPGVAHGFAGTGAPALLEVIGEQRCGTAFAMRTDESDVEWIEVYRPNVAWDRPGPPTDLAELAPRLIPPAGPI